MKTPENLISIDLKDNLKYKLTSTTGGVGAFTSETGDLTVVIDLVVLEDGQLNLLVLVLDLLGSGVAKLKNNNVSNKIRGMVRVVKSEKVNLLLLLSLLTTTTHIDNEVNDSFVFDVVVGESARII